jgi:replicative DNA helicase
MEALPIRDVVPPQDLNAEQAALGSMLIEPDAVLRCLQILQPEDFYRDAHKIICKAIRNVFERHEPVDVVTVTAELRRQGQLEDVGGTAYLAALIDSVPTAAHVVRYARIVEDKATLRKLIHAGSQIVAMGYEDPADVSTTVDGAERLIFEIAQKKITREFREIGTLVKEAFDRFDLHQRDQAYTRGVPTGLSILDDWTSGLQKSELIIVAGRPSMGKTSLAVNNFARFAASSANVPVGIFSLEMSKEQLVEGMLCSEASVDSSRLRRGKLTREDWQKIARAADRLYKAPIFIDDTPGISVLEMMAKARRLKAEHNVGLLVVDYLQLAAGFGQTDSRFEEISQIARGLKSMARELEIPVVVLSQLNRQVERRENKRPILSDLAESGSIEAEADLVMFLYRDSYYKQRGGQEGAEAPPPPSDDTGEQAELIIGKHRNGPTGTIDLVFKRTYRRFGEMTTRPAGE